MKRAPRMYTWSSALETFCQTLNKNEKSFIDVPNMSQYKLYYEGTSSHSETVRRWWKGCARYILYAPTCVEEPRLACRQLYIRPRWSRLLFNRRDCLFKWHAAPVACISVRTFIPQMDSAVLSPR